jgi:hypothetical protein
MDREEDVAILREMAQKCREDADYTSLKIAVLADKLKEKWNLRESDKLNSLRGLHTRQKRKVTALTHAIAALIEEGERDE